jgi:hypothetical protein
MTILTLWSGQLHHTENLNDVEGWKEANPALGRTIDISALKPDVRPNRSVYDRVFKYVG